MMRAPRFWERGGSRLPALLLAPLAALWRAETRRRLRRGPWRQVGVPVICLGNLTVGGTGKTPAVAAVLERIATFGLRPAVVSRGYGGREPGPLRVLPERHLACDVGDEPLLLSAWAPVWIGRDREAAARASVAEGAEVVVLDDGFQNPGLAKDLSLLVVDGAQGFGNGRVVPAGPLREPVEEGLARADGVLVIGGGADTLASEWPALRSRPLLRGRFEPLMTGMPWKGLRVLAFAGIGRPEKFFATLRDLGADVVRTRAFADHQPYGQPILQRLAAEAATLGAQLVTTEKDAVRLPPDFRPRVQVLPVRLVLDDLPAFDAMLAAVLDRRRSR